MRIKRRISGKRRPFAVASQQRLRRRGVFHSFSTTTTPLNYIYLLLLLCKADFVDKNPQL